MVVRRTRRWWWSSNDRCHSLIRIPHKQTTFRNDGSIVATSFGQMPAPVSLHEDYQVTKNLRLAGLTKLYNKRAVVEGLDLEIEAGRFYTLLGPSGCGKTTTLRMIAGLERPDAGAIHLGDQLISSSDQDVFVVPEKRGMGMVFQSYAVWPHMTVAGNVEFPLRLRGVSAKERRIRVGEVLEMVGLEAYHASSATALSGGQQQRVALARALVYRPEVLLLDEPLSNLDAKLREQMRLELRQIQQRAKITTIMVTHDQIEAMVVSDQVVVMNNGRIEQIGAPESVYHGPRTAFVMNFLGRVNYVPAEVIDRSGLISLTCAGGMQLRLPDSVELHGAAVGQSVTLCLRSEDMTLVSQAERRADDWEGRVEVATFLGQTVEYFIRIGDARLRTEGQPATRFAEGDSVYVRPSLGAVRVWPTHVAAGN